MTKQRRTNARSSSYGRPQPERQNHNRRTFFRYCTNCRRGFTKAAFQHAHFCPRCGWAVPFDEAVKWEQVPLETVRHSARSPAGRGQPNQNRRLTPATQKPKVFDRAVRIESLRPATQQIAKWVREHPVATGAGTAALGVGLIFGAAPVLAAGAALAASGAAVASTGSAIAMVGGGLGLLARSPGLFLGALAVGGAFLGLGALIAAAGGLVVAASGVMGIAGTALAYGGGALAIGGIAAKGYALEQEHGYIGQALAAVGNRAAVEEKQAAATSPNGSNLNPISTPTVGA